jgi:nucleotide-binding universal stress UspA family protein
MNDAHATQQLYTIVVGVDYSEVSGLALAEAVTLARSHERSHIHLVHSIPGMPAVGPASGTPDLTTAGPVLQAQVGQDSLDIARDTQVFVEKVLRKLEQQDAERPPSPTPRFTTHIRRTDPARAIVELAADLGANLVVVGTHGRTGLARFLLGSVAEGVVRSAPCPVLVVRAVGAESATDAPKIEPLCAQCLEVRRASAGAELWCARHQEHHARAHTYHFTPFRDSHQSGTLLHPVQ